MKPLWKVINKNTCADTYTFIHIHAHVHIYILVEEGEEGGDKPNHVTLRSVLQDCRN